MEGPVTTTDEATWIARARSGDGAAFDALYTRYERQIYAYVYRTMNGNPDDATDLTQETFLKAYKALGKTSDDLNISAWLHRIAYNTCLDELRRRQRIRWQPWDIMKHDRLLRGSAGENPERSTLRCSRLRASLKPRTWAASSVRFTATGCWASSKRGRRVSTRCGSALRSGLTLAEGSAVNGSRHSSGAAEGRRDQRLRVG